LPKIGKKVFSLRSIEGKGMIKKGETNAAFNFSLFFILKVEGFEKIYFSIDSNQLKAIS